MPTWRTSPRKTEWVLVSNSRVNTQSNAATASSQHGRTRRADSPSAEDEAIVAVNALLVAESECKQRVLLVEEIDHEVTLLADARLRACVPVDANEE
jgi:hypothetical protein